MLEVFIYLFILLYLFELKYIYEKIKIVIYMYFSIIVRNWKIRNLILV